MIAIAIFFTHALQFYVPMEIIWKTVRGKFSASARNAAEYTIRILLVVCTIKYFFPLQWQPSTLYHNEYIFVFINMFQMLTVGIAIAIPTIGPFITLIGAVCLSTLGLMFPSIIEIITYYEKPGFGRFNWLLWKNFGLIIFGIIGFITGSYVGIGEIREMLAKQKG